MNPSDTTVEKEGLSTLENMSVPSRKELVQGSYQWQGIFYMGRDHRALTVVLCQNLKRRERRSRKSTLLKLDRSVISIILACVRVDMECEQTIMTTQKRGIVRSVGFAPDETFVIAGFDNGETVAWNTSTSTQCSIGIPQFHTRTFRGKSNGVTATSVCPRGSLICSGFEGGSLHVWDARTGTSRYCIKKHRDRIYDLAFSPDARRILTASRDTTLRISWSATGKTVCNVFKGHTAPVRSCAWSPCGQFICSGSMDRTLRMWDSSTAHCLHIFMGHAREVLCCSFSPLGDVVCSGSWDKTLKVWSALNGKCLWTLKGHSRIITSCDFSPDGTCILSGSQDRSLRLWHAATGAHMQTLEGHETFVMSCQFSKTGKILSGSRDKSLKIWA